MCGIVGYIGPRQATDFLVEGLRRLEYRGYDSSGVATVSPSGELSIIKSSGRIDRLASLLAEGPLTDTIGIGHTRWATHGAATDVNAHPHTSANDTLAIVHNGVIENYSAIKDRLIQEGYKFITATDSEVIAQLIASCYEKQQSIPINGQVPEASTDGKYAPLITAVQSALSQLQGTYGLAVVFRDHPDVLIAARLGSPMVLGVGTGEHFIASDPSPLVGHTDKIVYLSDNEVAVVTTDSLRVIHRDQGPVQHSVTQIEIDPLEVELGQYPHYMLKEIFEQPETLENTMRGRLSKDEASAHLGGLNLTPQHLRSVDRIVITACGTSWHAALVGEYLFEEFARIPVEVEYASELRYRNPPMDNNTLIFTITQSGETADTLAAQREMQRKGHAALAICNTVGSTIARESDGGVYLRAGREIGVASTKAFTSQCAALVMLALHFGRLRHMSVGQGLDVIRELERLPEMVRQALETNNRVQEIAAKYQACNTFLYLGRQYNFPTALEGALKLKEISYIHAEGYPAAEMKHGPIALVDDNTPSVFLIPHGLMYEKVMANLEEIKARGGPIIAVVCEGDTRVAELADDVIQVPNVVDYLQPIITTIPLQLLSYHIAVLRGCDVDKPRNLAKSVTVE